MKAKHHPIVSLMQMLINLNVIVRARVYEGKITYVDVKWKPQRDSNPFSLIESQVSYP